MKAVTIESLKREIEDNSQAVGLYDQIAEIGGFGNIGSDFVNGRPALDISGLSESKQKRIQELIAEAKAPAAKEPEKPKGDKK